ncbi:uncharacterized protein LOC105698760 [Orussus abietinus]|uniref:uncharacterized protein LOC105698760 n=1 Tax=Orussus abietinus TaxID=222816 RepID=UPI0006250E6A|nr:uncharacterized protein LOC105698760 [Orussus abietinus]
MPKKTSTERVRAFRERKRAQRPPKKAPKTPLQRLREFRARQKARKCGIPLDYTESSVQTPTMDNFNDIVNPSTSSDTLTIAPPFSRVTWLPCRDFDTNKMENVYVKSESVHDQDSTELEYPADERDNEPGLPERQTAESSFYPEGPFAIPKLEMARRLSEPSEIRVTDVPKEVPLERIRRDGAAVYGEHVANKLRTYDAFTRADVEHKINCILHEADMRVLYRSR